MTELSTIEDAQIRHFAETNFSQNVVVVAGAGTGKTTLLVNRLLAVLFREPDPIPITQIVALTFTNKAAAEMKMRLQEQLLSLVECGQQEVGGNSGGRSRMLELQERYRLTVSQIVARAQAALDDLEKAQIGTLHSFAAHLLRLHPLETGMPPSFHEDDGTRLEEYFNQEWELWIDHELNRAGRQHLQWRKLLSKVRLEQIRRLAFELCLEAPPLDQLIQQMETTALSDGTRAWWTAKRDHAVMLLESYDRPKRRKIEAALSVAEMIFAHVLNHEVDSIARYFEDEKCILFSHLGKMPKGWTEKHFAAARGLIRLAQSMYTVDHDLLRDLLRILTPLLRTVQETFQRSGWITFQGLLIRARALLRDYPVVRERFKREYRAILVDEFQDTDPIQYEVILFLCEEPEGCAQDWQSVTLSSGKLFIVGDPKQSIYTFRGADLEAFEQVVEKIKDSGGVVYELATNFRSHRRVLDVVNEVFNQLFLPERHVQPGNISLLARPNRNDGLHNPGVEARFVNISDAEKDIDSETITRFEADQLACWIKEDLLANERLLEPSGSSRSLRPGHIGILFRKLTHSQVYLEALQRHGVPYVTDGEKHFYRRQEIIDVVNLFRVVENPWNSVAMLGVLRSSLGGLTDYEVYELRQRDAFDYRELERLSGWKNPKHNEVTQLYTVLASLHEIAFRSPLLETIDEVFFRLPIMELATASVHGEQASANLMKVRMIAAELVGRPRVSFSGFVNLLVHRLEQQPVEAERALAEESLDAVRILTIHKAKGLEFPVVVVPGLHHGTQARTDDIPLSSDWSTGVMGLAVGGYSSFSSILTKEKRRVKEDAERRRLLYVAMTRAQERLVLSGGSPSRVSSGAFLEFLQGAGGSELGNLDCDRFTIGTTSCSQTFVPPLSRQSLPLEQTEQTWRSPPDLTSWIESWDHRDRMWQRLSVMPTHLTPTSQLDHDYSLSSKSRHARVTGGVGALIGTLTHHVLERWDFAQKRECLEGLISRVCEVGISQDYENERGMIYEEVTNILESFISSPIYHTLQRATILGREVPFTLPWDCVESQSQAINESLCVMEGAIDLIYEVDGHVWVADYKANRLTEKDLATWITFYKKQTEVYRQAAKRCLQLSEVKCQLIFLRLGTSVQV